MKFEDHNAREIFCKECNKWFPKYDVYKFQWDDVSQRYYLAVQSPKPRITRDRKEYARQWYQKNRDRHLSLCAVYRFNKKQALKVPA
jgi:hypothetical protein